MIVAVSIILKPPWLWNGERYIRKARNKIATSISDLSIWFQLFFFVVYRSVSKLQLKKLERSILLRLLVLIKFLLQGSVHEVFILRQKIEQTFVVYFTDCWEPRTAHWDMTIVKARHGNLSKRDFNFVGSSKFRPCLDSKPSVRIGYIKLDYSVG